MENEKLIIEIGGMVFPKDFKNNKCKDDCTCGDSENFCTCGDFCSQNCDCSSCAIQKCFNKLAKYEDLGLAPEQLKQIDQLYTEKCKEVVKLQKNNNWIPVKERLPEIDKYGEAYVLVCKDDEFIATTTYVKNEGFELWAESGEVIAWMPLPDPYQRTESELKEDA